MGSFSLVLSLPCVISVLGVELHVREEYGNDLLGVQV